MVSFKAKEILTPTLLPRLRLQDNADYAKFGPDADGFEAYISWKVLASMRFSLEKMRPDETGGLLFGRPMQDGRGPYLIVTDFEMAHEGEVEASPSYLRIHPHGKASIWNRGVKRSPVTEAVGWWHTHPTFSLRFSSADEKEQASWKEPYHIGIVVSGLSNQQTWGVYRGPQARLLKNKAGKPPSQVEPAKPAFKPLPAVPEPQVVTSVKAMPTEAKSDRLGVFMGAMALVVAALGVFVFWHQSERYLQAISNQPAAEQAIQPLPPPEIPVAQPQLLPQPTPGTIFQAPTEISPFEEWPGVDYTPH